MSDKKDIIIEDLEKEIKHLRTVIYNLENPVCRDCGKTFQSQEWQCSKCLIDHLDSL